MYNNYDIYLNKLINVCIYIHIRVTCNFEAINYVTVVLIYMQDSPYFLSTSADRDVNLYFIVLHFINLCSNICSSKKKTYILEEICALVCKSMIKAWNFGHLYFNICWIQKSQETRDIFTFSRQKFKYPRWPPKNIENRKYL